MQSSLSPTAKLKEDESTTQLDTFEDNPAYVIPHKRLPRLHAHVSTDPMKDKVTVLQLLLIYHMIRCLHLQTLH